MFTSIRSWVVLFCVLTVGHATLHAQTPLGTEITYQGRVEKSGSPLDDTADFEFSLWDAETNGNQIGSTQIVSNVTVDKGVFTVELDFGASAFDGDARWLQIALRSPHDPGNTQLHAILSPRQPITAAPYAQYALESPGSAWSQNGSDVYYDAGNVGIGTTAPTAPLQVEGTAVASNISVPNPDNPGATINLNWLNDVPRLRYGGSGAGNHNGFAIHGTGDSVKLRLLDNGALGLGTDSPGSVFNSKLDVIGGHVGVSNDYGFFSFNSTSDGIGAGLDTTSSDDLHLFAGGSQHATVTADGNVGIGRLDPLLRLHVEETGDGENSVLRLGRIAQSSGNSQSVSFRLDPTNEVFKLDVGGNGNSFARIHFGDSSSPDNDVTMFGNVGIGTTSPQATLHVTEGTSGMGVILPGLRVEQNATGRPHVIGGASENVVTADYAATISGGAYNSVENNLGTVGGGGDNTASGDSSTVGGGLLNEAIGYGSTVAGGEDCTAGDSYATVSGGFLNLANGWSATISGGHQNQANGVLATISGGILNKADGSAATVPGGSRNWAGGDYSLAAGRRAKVRDAAESGDSDGDEGTFIWADSTDASFTSTGPDQFLIRAGGGLGLNRNDPSHPLHVGTDGTNGNGAHLTAGGTWTSGSSRAWKENFRALDAEEILDRVAALPIQRWNYTGSDEGDHIGPTAEDFHAAFGLGHSEQYIATIDADGVALAAIQALKKEHDAAMARKHAEIQSLQTRLESLEALVEELNREQRPWSFNQEK